MTTSLHCFAICTGCESQIVSGFAWPSSSTGAATLRLPTWTGTCNGRWTVTLGDDSGRHHPTRSTEQDYRRSVTVPSALRQLSSGTICRHLFPMRHPSLPSGNAYKLVCSIIRLSCCTVYRVLVAALKAC